MSAKAQARIEEARRVADYLDSIGEPKRANDVRSICRANASYRVTLSQLHKDNMALRQMTEPYVAPAYPKPRPQRVTVRADLIEHAAKLIADRDPKLAELFNRMAQELAA